MNVEERVANGEGFLNRSDLRELGLGRRAVDAVFRAVPVVAIGGYSRPLITVKDFQAYIDEHTFDGKQVRP